MTISEYIARLKLLKKEHGDLQVADFLNHKFWPAVSPIYVNVEHDSMNADPKLGKEFIGL